MTERESEKSTLADPFLRMGRALAAVPELGGAAAWSDWLAAMLPEATLTHPGRVILGMSIAGDGRRVTAQIINNADTVAPRLHEFLVAQQAPEVELDRIRLLGGRFHPPQIGVWQAWELPEADAGWFFPVAFPFNVALAESPPQPDVAALRVWSEANRVRSSAGFGRAVLGSLPHSALQIILPSPEVDIQLAAAAAAIAAVGLPPLPAMFNESVTAMGRGALRLSIWLSDQGVVKAGLLVPRPVPELVDALQTVVPPSPLLAPFMSALTLAEPAVLEGSVSHADFGVTYHFNVPTHGS